MRSRRVTLSEVLAVAAFVLATFGISFALYRLVADFREGTIIVGLSGWNYAFGVLPWLMVLLCAGVVLALRIRGLPAGVRRALPFVAGGLAALALVFVIVAFADKPGEVEFGRSVVENIDRDELMDIAGRAMGWESLGTGIGYGAGPFLLLIAALLSLAAAALLIAGRVPAEGPAGAVGDGTVSPPAARSSGTSGEWRPPDAGRAGQAAVTPPDGPATVGGEAPTVAGADSVPAVTGLVDGEAPAAAPGTSEAASAVADASGAESVTAAGDVDLWATARPPAGAPGIPPVASDVETPTAVVVPAANEPSAATGFAAYSGSRVEAGGESGADGAEPLDGEAGPAEEPTDPARFCVRCGAPFRSSDERFCTRCGAPRPGA